VSFEFQVLSFESAAWGRVSSCQFPATNNQEPVVSLKFEVGSLKFAAYGLQPAAEFDVSRITRDVFRPEAAGWRPERASRFTRDAESCESSCLVVVNAVGWNGRWQCVLRDPDESSTYGRWG
jgi:hypothetical protein